MVSATFDSMVDFTTHRDYPGRTNATCKKRAKTDPPGAPRRQLRESGGVPSTCCGAGRSGLRQALARGFGQGERRDDVGGKEVHELLHARVGFER